MKYEWFNTTQRGKNVEWMISVASSGTSWGEPQLSIICCKTIKSLVSRNLAKKTKDSLLYFLYISIAHFVALIAAICLFRQQMALQLLFVQLSNKYLFFQGLQSQICPLHKVRGSHKSHISSRRENKIVNRPLPMVENQLLFFV